jgi:cell division protein FtsQ
VKRPQGFENARPRGVRSRQNRPDVSIALLESSGASEPDADTAPMPIVRAAEPGAEDVPRAPGGKRPASQGARGAAIPEPKPRGARPDRADERHGVASPEPAQAPADSPSVRAAARRRRRYERAEIKRFTRAARRRRLAWLIGAGSVVVVLLGAALVSVSPLMALRTVTVVGVQRVDAAAVRQALDGQLGTPLPLIDYSAVRRQLAKFPLIRSYSTEADPPGTLVVRVVERVPLALLKVHSGYQLVDQAGVVMQTTPDKPGGYPVIDLPEDASERSRNKEFAASAAVLAALPVGMLSQVGTASATGAQDVTLRLTSGVTVVWGGPDDAELKSSVLARLIKAAPGASVYDVSAPRSPVTR